MSLIEIILIAIIMGLIAVFYTGGGHSTTNEAKVIAAKIQIRNFMQGLELYVKGFGIYHTTEDGLESLLKVDPKTNIPIMKSIPKDPWGRPYIYKATENSFVIICLGVDGQEGGTGLNADIKSSDL